MLRSRKGKYSPTWVQAWAFKMGKKLLHSAAALGFEGVAIKVKCSC
jgi:hypothetical protein